MTVRESNPFREVRLAQGISQYELARRAGVSKHAVLRLEQGMYDKPLPSIVDYVLATSDYTNHALFTDYTTYQIAVREDNARLLGDIEDSLLNLPVGTHPLTYLRERNRLNPTELAKRLCISQTIIVHFEKRSIQQHTVPVQLIEALQDADYTEAETDCLIKSYAEYREWLLDSRELKLLPVVPPQPGPPRVESDSII